MDGISIMVWFVICRRLGLAILVYLCQSGVLVHFRFGVDVDGAIFGFVISFIAMVYAVQGSWCIWASAMPTASVRRFASLASLQRPLVKSSRICLLWRSSVIFVPAL
jgi:membrane associated rhomboid family serine protease